MNIVVSVTAIIISSLSFDRKNSATAIYSQCIDNVVEVKATSESLGESFGTAEIISTDGRLITNAHVVTYTRLNNVVTFEKYFIRFSNEDDYREVLLEKYNSETDIAVLKIKDINGLTFKPVKMGNSSKLQAGDKVYAVGNASNYGIGIFEGIISVPLVNISLEGITRSVIQCDLTIAAGNSGGALLNEKGELIGVTTFRIKDNSGNVIYGVVYCIPIDTVLEYINS